MAKSVDVENEPAAATASEEATPAQRAGLGANARVASVDALRGFTILLMVFVNDLGPAAPSWMHHIQPPRADGMTLADVVFPAFLFIVGISIPLSLVRARAAGHSMRAQLGHVFTRTLALLLMGLFDLNRSDDISLAQPLWGLLGFSSLILAWCVVPREPGIRRKALIVLKLLGIVGLVIAFAIFRREPVSTDLPVWGQVEHWSWLRTGWWGILGLIGWAYLTVSILILLLGQRREWLMGALAILMIFHIAEGKGGLFTRLESKPWLGPARAVLDALEHGMKGLDHYIDLAGATGSLAAIAMAGCLLGTILQGESALRTHRTRVQWVATFIVGLFLAGFVTDTFEGINKIGATPTWCLWSAAITALVWAILYLLMDVAGVQKWSIVVRPAGMNPLVAYFLHPIVIWVISLFGLDSTLLLYKSVGDPWLVVAGSLGMALFVCAATGVLTRLGLRMRL